MKTSSALFVSLRNTLLVGVLTMSLTGPGCAPSATEKELKGFISAHVETIKPLAEQRNLASWDAAASGKAEDYQKASELTLRIRQVYSDPDAFAFLKELKESGQAQSPRLARQLDVMYYRYLQNQIEPELLKRIVDLGTEIEKNFSTFRGTVEGEKVTGNDIKEILKTQTDSRIPLNWSDCETRRPTGSASTITIPFRSRSPSRTSRSWTGFSSSFTN
ncbi:MAG: hypothetical protein ACYTAO_22415 [Planctomycetota bacterium]|jgi:peptidyl-dipeptidase A